MRDKDTYLISLTGMTITLLVFVQINLQGEKIDSISERLDCIPYEISQQLNKPYNKGISLACLEEK